MVRKPSSSACTRRFVVCSRVRLFLTLSRPRCVGMNFSEIHQHAVRFVSNVFKKIFQPAFFSKWCKTQQTSFLLKTKSSDKNKTPSRNEAIFLFQCNVDLFVRAKLKSRWGQLKKWFLFHLETKSSGKNITASRNEAIFLLPCNVELFVRAKLKSRVRSIKKVMSLSLENKIIRQEQDKIS